MTDDSKSKQGNISNTQEAVLITLAWNKTLNRNSWEKCFLLQFQWNDKDLPSDIRVHGDYLKKMCVYAHLSILPLHFLFFMRSIFKYLFK